MRGLTRFYYSNSVGDFLLEDNTSILGMLTKNHEFALEEQQRNAWFLQINYLKEWLKKVQGHIIFEYSIPRMGKRIDCVIISGSGVFAIEFKVGENVFHKRDEEQALDYALDLKNFHKESHHLPIIPILICTEADTCEVKYENYEDDVYQPILSSGKNLDELITFFNLTFKGKEIDVHRWITSEYHPTPTIIEAAQALYQGHSVDEISRSDAGAYNLTRSSETILEVIRYSKENHCKSICFLTGVPGAGKTLAGLNLANQFHDVENSEHTVFLSGNGPLVDVLREALVRDVVEKSKMRGVKLKKKSSESKTKAFIQNIHHFRDEGLKSDLPPIERVVVFDEAQRAWDKVQTAKFMKKKKGIASFEMSEPEFLISYMNRHNEWATVICLIGGGQEINSGEAGIQEWFNALNRSFSDWSVFVSPTLEKDEELSVLRNSLKITYRDTLHLSVSVRSFRSEKVSNFVKALLDSDRVNAQFLFEEIKENYPIVITRDLEKAKRWIREKARGSERYGVVASSGGLRLRPEGINVKVKIDPKHWFLNDSTDVRSSYFLEEVATEFDIQGLELDWSIVAWDADLRFMGENWEYKNFRGNKWINVHDTTRRDYLKNAYRVLLTRARQGMVIFVPYGNPLDHTRKPEFYTHTYEYLKSLKLIEI